MEMPRDISGLYFYNHLSTGFPGSVSPIGHVQTQLLKSEAIRLHQGFGLTLRVRDPAC